MASLNSSTASPITTAPRWITYLLPRFGDMLFAAIFAAVVLTGPTLLNGDGDLGRHITLGNYILDTFSIPTRDLFSHTLPNASLTPHEWLAQTLFAAAHRLLGLDGVVILCALLLAATGYLVFRNAVQRSRWVLLALFFTVLAAAASHLHWLARPHLWTFLMVVLWTSELERFRSGATKRWWLLPALMLFWVNLHGAYIAGVVLWLLYSAGIAWEEHIGGGESFELNLGASFGRGQLAGANLRLALHPRNQPFAWKPWLVAGGLTLLATLLNPVGWRIWETSLGYLRNRYLVDHTYEYFSPNFHTSATWPFLFLIVLIVLLLGMGWLRLPPTHTFLLSAWVAMGLYSARNIPLMAWIAAPILAEGVAASGSVARLKRVAALDTRLAGVDAMLRGHLLAGGLILLLAIPLAFHLPVDFKGQGNRFSAQVFPVKAVDWLEDHPLPGKGFNHFPWGGYLLYRLWPEQRVFIDGQTDFYGETLTREYETVITLGEGWEQVLDEYQIAWALTPADSLLARALTASGWTIQHRDTLAIIFSQSE